MILRVSDNNVYGFVQDRLGQVQADVRRLQEQLVTGRRLVSADQDPLGAGDVVRSTARLAALGQYDASASFGGQALQAQDDALEQATNLLVRAEELASQQASGFYDEAERAAAAQEVHGLLQQMVALGNSEFAGRRLFSGLALDAPAPFGDPDATGWTPATAWTGSTFEPEYKIGPDAGDRVRVATRGDTIFGSSLSALKGLEDALTNNTAVNGSITALAGARDVVAAERASVGARQRQLSDRGRQIDGLTLQETSTRSKIRDVDFAVAASQLAEAQTALQALLAAASQMKETSLAGLLNL